MKQAFYASAECVHLGLDPLKARLPGLMKVNTSFGNITVVKKRIKLWDAAAAEIM